MVQMSCKKFSNLSLAEMKVFIKGFRSCANETINYLIEDEGLSPEDPVVVNIREHLKVQEKMYLFQWIEASIQEAKKQRPPKDKKFKSTNSSKKRLKRLKSEL